MLQEPSRGSLWAAYSMARPNFTTRPVCAIGLSKNRVGALLSRLHHFSFLSLATNIRLR